MLRTVEPASARRASPSSPAPSFHFGGQPLLAKLAVGASSDPLEQEADRAADQVMRGEGAPRESAAPVAVRRMCAACGGKGDGEEQTMHRRAAGAQPGMAEAP